MTGFEAISAANGWAMALTGILIVITGLAVLSMIISQLHRVIVLFEPRDQAASPVKSQPQQTICFREHDFLKDLDKVARIYASLSAHLVQPFELTSLFEILKPVDVPHPHLSVRSLREAGYLVPAPNGKYRWNNMN